MLRRNQIVGHLATVRHRAISLDGVTQRGVVTLAVPLTLSGAVAIAVQCAHVSGYSSLARLRKSTGTPFLDLEAPSNGATKSNWFVSGGLATAVTSNPGADSAGYLVTAGSAKDIGGGLVRVRIGNRGPVGASNPATNEGTSALTNELTQLYVYNNASAAYSAGFFSRLAVWTDDELTADDIETLYGDGTLAVDWRTVLSGRPPALYYRAWDAVEAGSTLEVPEAMANLGALVFHSTDAADLSDTIPTGVA